METHENIKILRERLGLSQDALAEKVGYKDRSSIAKIEAGKIDLSQSKIAAFSKALNVTPTQLMGMEPYDDESPQSVQDYEDLNEYLEVLKNRAECRMLFSVTKDATKEDVEKAVAIIEALRRTEGR